MNGKRKIIVGLPAYNEEQGLPKLLDKLVQLRQRFEVEIVVINDGSSDETEKILQEYSKKYYFVHFINHEMNKGLGEAMQTLIKHSIHAYNENDILVTLDADNTHNPSIIPELVKQLEENKLDIVIASRFAKGGMEIGLSPIRKIYSRGAKMFFKAFYPIPFVNDYSCGYRAYRISYLKKAFQAYNGRLITTNGFECMVEILARFSKIGVHAGEYPLKLEYNLKESESKLPVVKTIVGYFKLLKKVKKPTF